MEKIIQFDKVEIKINNKKNLNNINLAVNEKDFIYLIGKTGSGKSSILRTIYADMPINIGEAKVLEYNLTKIKRKEIPFLRRKIGVIFQDFKLLPDRSVSKNLEFVLKATEWKNKQKIKERIYDVLERVKMNDYSNRFPHELSGGEKQRVSIARALLNNPKLVLADEPTGNLDPATSMEIMNILNTINLNGTSIIMATHDYDLISKNPKKTIRLEDNRLYELLKKT
ncbi:MAG: ATP-binding cassette domain-containing protein [Bacteroidota bacterium]|nr:ATP-binding cassette domain-containing protein [Bacteroidota bacterium]MEC7548974.1 ATP-binding cassette domain-containing protein [Bacteroidota bacterium]MEC8602623.1 ATP-binding cassette domain-containing protein [Bacteroidota bacterium]|tara:strand:- start:940 stop:1617 length:678 start_codon:yes stop_codon:yes gene_type:complete